MKILYRHGYGFVFKKICTLAVSERTNDGQLRVPKLTFYGRNVCALYKGSVRTAL